MWMFLMEMGVSDRGQFVVETSNSWISVYRYDEVFNDYDKDEEQLVRSLVHNPVPYLIEWRGDELLKKFIEDFPLNNNAVIDNDHGIICNISKLKGKPVSDWVREKK